MLKFQTYGLLVLQQHDTFERWNRLLPEIQSVDLANLSEICRGHGRRGCQVALAVRLRRNRPRHRKRSRRATGRRPQHDVLHQKVETAGPKNHHQSADVRIPTGLYLHLYNVLKAVFL